VIHPTNQEKERHMSIYETQDLTRGWNAAANLEPFDQHESKSWKQGYQLWHSRAASLRIASIYPDVSVALH
jgi:hypothetical protein